MMPRERGGVVDSRLNVYGVKGLKVAGMLTISIRRSILCSLRFVGSDLSIAPLNVGAVSNFFPPF